MTHRRRSQIAASNRNTPFDALAYLQMCLAIDAQNPLDVHLPAISAQKHGQTPIAEPSPFRCQFFKTSTKRRIVFRNAYIADHPAIRSDVPAGLAFTDVELLPSRLYDSTLLHRR